MSLLRVITIVCLGISPFATLLQAAEENPYKEYRKEAISSAAGTPWSASRQVELVEAATALAPQIIDPLLIKTYPISEKDLQQIYQHANSNTIPFFAYSSMIAKDAGAVKAISPQAAATQLPALAFGLQRTFNREMPAATVEGGWGALMRPNDLAILNVFKKEDAVLNGVLFQLPLEDLLILSKREVGYNLVPVLTMYWNDALDEQKQPKIFLAYTFQAPNHTGEGVRYTNSNINPVPGYFNSLQKGLKPVGEDFTAMWWATTYLADQKTLVDELPYDSVDLKTGVE